MLRDRTPKVVIFALKWCKATETWLNHVYKTSVWVYSSKKERNKAVRNLLKLDTNEVFKFADTIDWNNVTDEEKERFESADEWVSWFQQSYSYIENDYNIQKKRGLDVMEIKYDMMIKYLSDYCPNPEDDEKTRAEKNLYVNKFADFLINCFEDRI